MAFEARFALTQPLFGKLGFRNIIKGQRHYAKLILNP